MSYNCVDRHVENGRGEQVAIYYDSPVTNQQQQITYSELQDRVSRFAGVLKSQGVQQGDRVVIYMPMIPDAAVAMLACARIGAVHSVVFGGFASKELAVRIDDAKPTAVVAASCGVEPTRIVEYEPLLEGALEIADHKPSTVIVKNRSNIPTENEIYQMKNKLDWDEMMKTATAVGCTPVKSQDPLYVLYTSGTTGAPKGVLRDTGGYAAMLSYSMKTFMQMEPGETYWAASDIGWVVGHSYIIYGPLLNGCSTIMYEGKPIGTPDAGVFWRIIEQYGVKSMFTAPTALRAIRRVDPGGDEMKKYDLKHLRALFVAGERGDPVTISFFHEQLGKPVIDNFWQTETGAPVAGFQLEEVGLRPGSAAAPTMGYHVEVLCEHTSKPLPRGKLGDLAIKLPLPPGAMKTIYNADQRFVDSYLSKHAGYYLTGDAGFIDNEGYIHIMARTDDVINCAGHRLSSGALEEVLISHPDVAECAVIGAKDEEKGQIPVGFIVLASNAQKAPEQIEAEVVDMVRRDIGPVAAFKLAFVVPGLPKTRSGKILRGIMHNIADEEEYRVPGTIEDMSVLENVEKTIRDRYLKK
eukprot:CAMPEP_0184011094 /NCGR_PEP_ID=MMETSP0954-20121128/3620_1 /TAXON_ID=627963 /ORGANISM="Aplanochytrium sp, Strain PBS07" /LENGTH=579 /DNA_ID=CAMNT_0026290841 /DNA_START=315 /DNA_END=2054 /DNA_ORIENTATION=+